MSGRAGPVPFFPVFPARSTGPSESAGAARVRDSPILTAPTQTRQPIRPAQSLLSLRAMPLIRFLDSCARAAPDSRGPAETAHKRAKTARGLGLGHANSIRAARPTNEIKPDKIAYY